ncbi:MAG: hypothetical protein ACKPKO_14035, partial [Candidatus Fonsibacter sp.]
MHDTDLDWEMYGYGIDYGKKTTREYKIRTILEAQKMMGDFIEMRPRSLNPPPPPKTQYFPLTPPPPKAKMFPMTPPPKTQYQLFPMTPSGAHTLVPMTLEQARKALSPPTT